MTPTERWAVLVQTMVERSNSTFGADETRGARRAFGATSLKANGKIFAIQMEWLSVNAEEAGQWLAYAAEAERFVSGRG